MYRIVLEQHAAKEIEALSDDFVQRITIAIRSLSHTPRPHGTKKLIGNIGWRLRVGDYRILYTIDDQKRIVAIYRVKHRREVYR